jgi:hypothetical protein
MKFFSKQTKAIISIASYLLMRLQPFRFFIRDGDKGRKATDSDRAAGSEIDGAPKNT